MMGGSLHGTHSSSAGGSASGHRVVVLLLLVAVLFFAVFKLERDQTQFAKLRTQHRTVHGELGLARRDQRVLSTRSRSSTRVGGGIVIAMGLAAGTTFNGDLFNQTAHPLKFATEGSVWRAVPSADLGVDLESLPVRLVLDPLQQSMLTEGVLLPGSLGQPLVLFSAAQARTCLAGRRVTFSGDSVTSLVFIGLANILVGYHGSETQP